MSIFKDDRIVSDDIWEYSEWLNELKRECRKDAYSEDDDLVVDLEEEEE